MKRRTLLFLVIFPALLSGCSLEGYFAYEADDSGSITAYFCPESNCSGIMAGEIRDAEETAYCAFYELDLHNIIDSLNEKSKTADVRVVTDNSNPTSLSFARTDNRTGLMHNKFCIIDGKTVITGSYNPTFSGLDNENNLLVIESGTLAKNYLDEFNEMWNGYFGRGNRVAKPEIKMGNITVENYFCPEDWCTDKVLKTISLANESVRFMIFSFTDDSVGELLIEKHKEGIEVSGLLDNFQNKGSQYSEYKKMLAGGINISLYGDSKMFLHNKVFIIDGKIVITGSYNPTRNGDEVNDENILIIYDEGIAQEYESALKKLINSAC